jgi:hypothetical protein
MGDGLIRAISSIFNAKSITQIRPSLFPVAAKHHAVLTRRTRFYVEGVAA